MKFWDELFPEWELSEAIRGEWSITNTVDGRDPYVTTDFAIFEIYYSKKLRKYKFEMIGYKPKQHSLYPDVVRWVAEQNELETKKTNIT